MKRSLLDIISIGANDAPVQLRDWDAAAASIDYGLLLDPDGKGCCPILAGFALFTESAALASQFIVNFGVVHPCERHESLTPAQVIRT